MSIKKFMNCEDDIEKYVEGKLDEIADCFYQFAHGFIDLDMTGYPDKYLKDAVPDEYNKENGILKKHFDVIYKLEDKLKEIEESTCKDEQDFNFDESIVEKLRVHYQDLIQSISNKMFLYGVKFGTRLNKKI